MVVVTKPQAVFSLNELGRLSGSQVRGDGECLIRGVNTLEHARAGEISFFINRRYRKHLQTTQASAVVLHPKHAHAYLGPALLNENPYLAWAKICACFKADETPAPGIAQTALIADSAHIDPLAHVAAGAVIGEHSKVRAHAYIGPNVVLGRNVEVGRGSRLLANVVVQDDVRIGENCLVHPGAVIGSDGFGLAPDGERWIKVPQLGSVIIEDDVEIGANTTIDRGALRDTVIHQGAKLDNQIQIAHNVEIGENTAIAACTGIAGSTRIGRNCTLAGGVGIVGHVELGDDVHVSGAAVVARSLKKPGLYTSALLAMPHRQWQKNVARLKHLDELARQVQSLEKQLQSLRAALQANAKTPE